jgi:hypothetical protein
MFFNGINNLRAERDVINMEPWMLKELRRCKKDPIYFARNYVMINTKDGGMQLFDTREYQDELIRKYRFNITLACRQSGKSTVSRAFLLHYVLFNAEKVVAILANKLMLAQEQLQQLRDSYINLPLWMQPGVRAWNKKSIELSNASRVMCAATSPDGIRGMSINCVSGNSEVELLDTFTQQEFKIDMEGLAMLLSETGEQLPVEFFQLVD